MPFSAFMDPRTKPKKSEIIVVDQSALAKSAAWAWYEHNSSSEARSLREIDVWSSKTEPRPSRYKLELLRNLQSDNSLLDSYEIERISKQLDHFIESSHAKYHGGDPTAKHQVLPKKKIPITIFWPRHVPMCSSSRKDVVENRKVKRRSKMPEKGCVPVAGGMTCRPRPGALRA